MNFVTFFKNFFNDHNITFKVILITIIRLLLLRLAVELTYSLIPVSNYTDFAELDDIYRGGFNLPAVWGWGNFDGNHYIGIAMRGYGGFEYPFFPLYPFLIKFIFGLGVEPLAAAQLISFLSKLVAMLLSLRLLEMDNKKNLQWLFVFVLLFYPTSFYFSAAYNDGLFFLLATSCIFFARKREWTWSIIAGSFAALARLNGLVLAIFIVIEYMFGNKDEWKISTWFNSLKHSVTKNKIWQSKIFLVLAIPGVFLGYLYWVEQKTGSWFQVFSSMSIWGQDRIIFPLQVFWRYFKIIVVHPEFSTGYFTACLEFSAVILYIFLLVKWYKKIRLSYWVLFAISILLPSLTGTFQGMPRYGLHLYPFFLMLALTVSSWKTPVKIIYIFVSAVLLFVLATMFVHGFFIA